MSLKAFHIVFIILASLVADGFGVWAIRRYNASADALILAAGIAGLAAGTALGFYLIWFLRKMKKVGE